MNKFNTLNSLESSGEFGEVWCINGTPSTDRAQITFSVEKMGGGGSDAVYVPVTFVPIQLTSQVTKKQLLNSGNFRRAVSMGSVRLITPEYAKVLLGESGVSSELERLRAESANSDFAQVAMASGVQVEVHNGNAVAMATASDDAGTPVAEEISAAILSTLAQLKDEEINEQDALNRIRGLGDLKMEEYKYISRETKGAYPMFTRWIVGVRNRLESGEENPQLA